MPRGDVRFTRLQSSHCEAGAYDKVLQSLDAELLLALATGRPCYLYDLGSRNKERGVPRAIFMGLAFARWAVAYLWFEGSRPKLVPGRVDVRGRNAVPFWRATVMPFQVRKETKRRVRYFARFAEEMGTEEVRLFGVHGRATEIDGCAGVHAKFAREWVEEGVREAIAAGAPEWLEDEKLVLYNSEATGEEVLEIQRRLNDKQQDGL